MSGFPGLPIVRPDADGKAIFAAYYSLWLHLPRQRMQRTAETMNAIMLAFSKGALPEALFEALALVPEDAKATAFGVNCQRELAAAKARAGFGG